MNNYLLEDICMQLNNCIDCQRTGCCLKHKLTCNQNLKITDNDTFYIDPYDEIINVKLIAIADRHEYDAGIIVNGQDEYLQFTKREQR